MVVENFGKLKEHTFIYIGYIKRTIPNIVFVYLAVIIIHWISSHLYPKLCCGNTVWGLIMSPFMIVTPHCEGLRWVIQFTGEKIRNAWFWLAGYLVSYIGMKISPLFLNNKYYTPTNNSEEHLDNISPKRKSVRTND
jgi:hypothetical protein